MKGYIYIIKNTINNKVYVGQTSRTIEDRWKQHKQAAFRGDNQGIILYNAIRKYGVENFYISQLEEVELEKLNEREIYWIQYYNCQTPNGYNVRKGGDDPGRKEVYKIDLVTNKVLECYGSAMTAAESNKIDLSLLTKVCRQEEGKNSCNGFKWCYAENYIDFLKNNNSKNTNIKNFQIYQIDPKTNEILKIWNSVKEASEILNIDSTGISHCLSGRYKTSHGYKWDYVDKNLKKNYTPSSNRRKKVLQYDIKTKQLIKEWDSAREASQELNITANSIQKNCRGTQKTAGGYIWKYKEE